MAGSHWQSRASVAIFRFAPARAAEFEQETRGEPFMPIPSIRLLAAFAVPLLALLPAAGGAHEQTTFKVTIRSVATPMTLKLPDGMTASAPIAPGAYAVVADGAAMFRAGEAAVGGLESLAEDGNAEPLIATLRAAPGVRAAGLFIPGQPFSVSARPGERLVFASMFVQSNDVFLAPQAGAIALFDAQGRPLSGDITAQVALWDAGTEVNEAPGVGANQAPRQAAPNSGPAEHAAVRMVDDGFAYPPVAEVVAVSLMAR
jgi:hypothetical protein